MQEVERIDSSDRPELLLVPGDARVVLDFAVGPSGVGPVMGFDSGDFYPAAPEPPPSTPEPADNMPGG